MDQQSRVRCNRHEAASAVDQVELLLGYVWLSEVAQQAEPHGSSAKQATKYPNFGVRNSKEVYVRSAGTN